MLVTGEYLYFIQVYSNAMTTKVNLELKNVIGFFPNIQAYDDEDWENVQRALQSPFIKHMDVDYARLANAVPLPEGIKNVPKATTKPTVVTNAQQAYTSPPPEEVSHVKCYFNDEI